MKVDIWIIGKPFDHCLQLFPKALQKMPAGSRSPVASVPILRMRSRLQVPTAFFRPRKAPAKPCRTPKLKQNLIAFVRTRRAEEVGSQWSARSDGPTGLRVDGGGSQARLRQNNGLQLRLEMSSAEERQTAEAIQKNKVHYAMASNSAIHSTYGLLRLAPKTVLHGCSFASMQL